MSGGSAATPVASSPSAGPSEGAAEGLVVLRSWSRARWRWARVALLLLTVLLGVAMPLVGQRPVAFADARAAVASGEIQVIQLRLKSAPGFVGGIQDVTWRRGGVTYVTDVDGDMVDAMNAVASTPGDDAAGGASPQDVVVRRFTAWVHGTNPAVTVETTTAAPPKLGGRAYGWALPGWLVALAALAGLGALALLVSGPEPRHATRWSWFWVSSVVPPVGIVAYLLLGARDERADAPSTRRLTGGWAFLWTSIVSTVVTNAF